MDSKTSNEKLRFIVAHSKVDVNLCIVAYQLLKAVDSSERPGMLETFIKDAKREHPDGTIELPVVISDREEMEGWMLR